MSTDVLHALAIFAVGLAAGTINTVVGSGTLITFPTLLALGYPAVLANASNNVGLVPGTFSGAYGYRSELGGQRQRIIRLGSASLCGGLVGAILLLTLPAGAFKDIVPVLIGVAIVMVVFQPRLSKWVAARQRQRAAATAPAAAPGGETGAAADTTDTATPDRVGQAGGPWCSAPGSTAATAGRPRACCCSASWASPSPTPCSGSTRPRTSSPA